MLSKITKSPLLVRVAPYILFILLTGVQTEFGEAGRYWIYLAKTLAGAGMLWTVREAIPEMRWNLSWEAVAAGVGVFVLWVVLGGRHGSVDQLFDLILAKIGIAPSKPATPWNPLLEFPSNAGLAWGFVVMRLVGSSVVVPPLEEVFFRSFLYRWIVRADFENEPIGVFAWKPFLIVAVLFGVEHQQWVAGILCGFIYQGLVIRKKRLGDAITAHAITNFLLAIWVVTQGAWGFW